MQTALFGFADKVMQAVLGQGIRNLMVLHHLVFAIAGNADNQVCYSLGAGKAELIPELGAIIDQLLQWRVIRFQQGLHFLIKAFFGFKGERHGIKFKRCVHVIGGKVLAPLRKLLRVPGNEIKHWNDRLRRLREYIQFQPIFFQERFAYVDNI